MASSGKKFLVPFLLSLLVWYGVYDLVIKPSYLYDALVIQGIATHAHLILSLLGYDVLISDVLYSGYLNHIAVLGSDGVVIGPGCDGLVIMALFFLFILFMPGKISNKLWFIPLGLLGIHLFNVLRVVCLALLMKFHPEWLDFNHDYTFTVLMYSFVFLLWVVWVKFYAKV